jgi:hypothetical protein
MLSNRQINDEILIAVQSNELRSEQGSELFMFFESGTTCLIVSLETLCSLVGRLIVMTCLINWLLNYMLGKEHRERERDDTKCTEIF